MKNLYILAASYYILTYPYVLFQCSPQPITFSIPIQEICMNFFILQTQRMVYNLDILRRPPVFSVQVCLFICPQTARLHP